MNQAQCSNCGEHAPYDDMLIVLAGTRTTALICPACQRAKKIQITLRRGKNNQWEYYQYFPVET